MAARGHLEDVLADTLFRDVPVRFGPGPGFDFSVRVFPSGPGFNFSGPVRSGFQKKSFRVFVSSPGLTFSRSGPGFTFKNLFGLF